MYSGQRSSLTGADTLSQGLVGWWPLGEGAGGLGVDASGYGNNLLINGSTWRPGRVGGTSAVTFAGATSSYASVASGRGIDIPAAGSVSMCFWVFLPSAPVGFTGFLSKRDDRLGSPYAYAINYATSFFQVYTSGSSGIQNFSTYTPATGVWSHIVATISAAPTELYVNGNLLGTLGSGGGVASNAATLNIGDSGFGVTGLQQEPLVGSMYDVRIYNRRITPSEVRSIYREGWRPFLMRLAVRVRAVSTLVYQTWSNPAERLSLLRADLSLPLERLTSVERVVTLPLSHLASRIARTTSQPSEILGLQQSQILIPAERLVIMRADRLSPIESLQSAREDTAAPAERLALVQETSPFPILPSLLTQSGWTSPSEWLSTAAVSVALDQERLSLQISTISSPGEREGSVLRGAAVPLERLSSLSGGWTLSLEHKAEIMSAWVSPAERLLGAATTWVIPLERQSTAFSVEQDWSSPAEWLASVLGARTMASEHLLRVRETWSLPIQLSFVTAMWIEPGPGCWTVLARDMTVTVLLIDVTMSVETP